MQDLKEGVYQNHNNEILRMENKINQKKYCLFYNNNRYSWGTSHCCLLVRLGVFLIVSSYVHSTIGQSTKIYNNVFRYVIQNVKHIQIWSIKPPRQKKADLKITFFIYRIFSTLCACAYK